VPHFVIFFKPSYLYQQYYVIINMHREHSLKGDKIILNKISNSYNKRNYYLLLLVVFSGFLVFGFSENIKGPALPRMQAEFSLNEFQLGLLLSFNSLGYLLACSFTGFLVKRFGIRLTTILAFSSMAISGIFIFLSINFPTLSASYFFMYIGNGMLEIALAVLGAKIFTKNTGKMMNLAHFFYGLSSAAAPIFSTLLMRVHLFGTVLGWRGTYLIMLSLALFPIIPSVLSKSPDDDIKEEDRMPMKEYIRDPAAWLLVIILTFGVISELAVGGWLVNFLEKAYKWDTNAASGLLSAFFCIFMLSRLFLGPITDKIGFTKSLIIFSAASGACSIFAILLGESAAFLFALAGAGIALIYPTVMAFIAKRYSKNSDTAISFTVTLMGIGSIIGNFLIGAIIDLSKSSFTKMYGAEKGLVMGLQAGYIFIGTCALLCAASSIVLYIFLKRKNQLL